MKKTMTKITLYAMIGMMSFGLMNTAAEASAQTLPPAHYQMMNADANRQHDEQRAEQEVREKEKAENERHQHEMQRRPHESERDWQERIKQEIERHKHAMQEIREHAHHNREQGPARGE